MKKLFIILIFVFSLSIAGCKYTDSGNYEFIKKEDVKNALSIYYAKVTMVNVDSSIDTFIMGENAHYYYYNFKNNYYLVDKVDNLLYSINHEEKVKLLEKKKEFDYAANKNVLVDLISEHIDIVNKDYQMSKETTDISGFDCYEYNKTTKRDNNNYVIRKYYVDSLKGYCIKGFTEVCSQGDKSVSSWYVNELNFNNDYVNSYFDEINAFESKVAPIEFDSWPDMGLGLNVPKFTKGTFMFAVDFGENATISIEQITLQDVKSYTSSLVNYGYKEGKSITNEAAQYIYLTYNDDNILVRVSYTPSHSNLTITITQSTIDEINKELGKL